MIHPGPWFETGRPGQLQPGQLEEEACFLKRVLRRGLGNYTTRDFAEARDDLHQATQHGEGQQRGREAGCEQGQFGELQHQGERGGG